MNSSESSLLSSKIISGNPSLKRVWKDVHRVQHLKKLMTAAAHFHLSNNSKQQKKKEQPIRRKSPVPDYWLPAYHIQFGTVMKLIVFWQLKGSCEQNHQLKNLLHGVLTGIQFLQQWFYSEDTCIL